MSALFKPVFNRGSAPKAFISELAEWGKVAPDDIFAPNPHFDIYDKVKAELGPYGDILTRKCVMLEVLRVLAGFESSWDWTEGVDTSRMGDTTPENAEAGAWQVSYDARNQSTKLQEWLHDHGIFNGVKFQQRMKRDFELSKQDVESGKEATHTLAMEFEARLLRITTKHNGPLYKGDERLAIRRSLRGPEQSIYPWLSRDAVAEFRQLIA